jgi:hypothetical protein
MLRDIPEKQERRNRFMKKTVSLFLALLLAFACVSAAVADLSMDPDEVITLIRSAFANDDGIVYEFSYDEDTDLYYVYIAMDGLATAAALAGYNSDYQEQWTTMRASLTELNGSTLDFIDTLTSTDTASLALVVKNDANEDNVLLTILNSVVMYDAVDGTNLLGI